MFPTLSTPLVLALAGVVGILVGLLISTLFKGESKAAPEENPLPKKFIDSGYAEAARLFYSPAEKKALTQLDGDFYSDFAALTPEQKKRVLRILQSWQEWTGTNQISSSTGDQTIPAAGRQITPGSPSTGQGQTGKPPQLPDFVFVPEKVEPNYLSNINPKPAKPVAPAAKPVKPLTIVEQINDILETVVANSPEKNRGIHLVDNGHEGVLVWVGIEKFNGIDEIPYPEVKQLIQTAVSRWEDLNSGQTK